MRTVRCSISTAMILAAAAVAAGQETQKVLLPQGGTPTLEYKVIGQQEAEKAGPTEARLARVRQVRAGEERAAKQVESANERLRAVYHAPAHGDDAAVLSDLVKFRAAGSNDPHREVILRLRAVATESCTQCHAGGVSVRKDEALGLTLVPADETLRSQLKLEKTGLVVTEVAKGSSGEAGGIKEKDILVAFADKPLGDVESFVTALGEAGVSAKPAVPLPGAAARLMLKPIAVKIIRAGEAKELRVPPPFPPTLIVGRIGNAPEPTKAPSYWIGVQMGEVDDTLRSHLKLGDGAGLVVTDVLKGAPAEKAGLKKDDILVEIDGAPLKASEDMIKAVQASKGEKTITLRVRRAGDPIAVSVRPEKRADAPETTLDVKPREIGIAADGQQPQWVAQILPFIDKQTNQTFAYTLPGQQGQYWLWNAPNAYHAMQGNTLNYVPQPIHVGEQKEAEAQRKKAVEAEQKAIETMRRDLHVQIQRINSRLPQESEWKAVVESLKKTAPPAESLAKIDAQLKALEAQVGEIKRSMEELKGAVKREK
jgi:S1-C subfamily serine protease